MNILLTCAGRRNYLLQYFREALGTEGNIFVADSNPDASAMQEADGAFTVLPIYNPEYINQLLYICKENKIRLLISLNDLELPYISANRKRFEAIATLPVVSSMEVIDVCFDKWKTSIFAEKYALASPKTYLCFDDAKNAIESGELSFPLVVKPRWGSASIGIDIVYDLIEFELSYNLAKKRLPRSILSRVNCEEYERSILIQQMLHGEEYGLDIVNDLNGNYVSTFVKKKLSMRAGETDKAVTVDNFDLKLFGKFIGNNLNHIGNLDCDVFITDGRVYLLEMNPRFGGGYPFSHAAGAKLPDALVTWAKGQDADPAWFKIRNGIISSKCDRLVVNNGRLFSKL